jgi:hypothetical protein
VPKRNCSAPKVGAPAANEVRAHQAGAEEGDGGLSFCDKALAYTNGLDRSSFGADPMRYDATAGSAPHR